MKTKRPPSSSSESESESQESESGSQSDQNAGPYWEWDNEGTWQKYDDETNAIIEKAHQENQVRVKLNHGFFKKHGYTINFKKGYQLNRKTKFKRAIRRRTGSSKTPVASPPPGLPVLAPFSFIPFPMVPPQYSDQATQQLTSPTTPKWLYKDATGKWIEFERMMSSVLEGNWKRNTSSFTMRVKEFKENPVVSFDLTKLSLHLKSTNETLSLQRDPPIHTNKPKTKVQQKSDEEEEPDNRKKKKRKIDTESLVRECKELTRWVPYQPEHNEICPICLVEYTNDANPVQLPCKHNFCLNCVVQCYTKGFLLCAICKTCYGTMIGSMPPGKLSISHHPPGTIPLEGHENEGTIVLNMHIKSGIQGPDHPNPGEPYDGTSRTAYLPDNSEGRELLELFKVAWERKLMFRVGTSVTTGAENQVVWNGIHMKTNTHGGATSFGYPDPTYGQRVKEELAAKNIK